MNEEQMRAEFEDFRIRFGKAEGIKPNEDDAILLRKISWFLEASQAKSVPVGFYHKETGELKSVITSDDGNESDWIDVYTSPKPTDDRVRELVEVLKNIIQVSDSRDESGLTWEEIATQRSQVISKMNLIVTKTIVQVMKEHNK